MQRNTQHNLLGRSLLRSRLSDDEQISMIRHDDSQRDLISWLLWILKILVIFLMLVLFAYWLNSSTELGIWGNVKRIAKAPFNWFSWSSQTEKPCEIIKYVKETDKDLEHFKKIQAMRKKLQLAGLSVESFLPSSPNLDFIRKNPNQFENVTVIKQKIFSENLPPQSQLDQVLREFNDLIPFGNIDMSSTAQDQLEVKQKIENNIQQQDKLIKKMDDEFLESLRFNIQDFNSSYKNFLIKREKIQNFRQQFLNVMNQLKDCQKILKTKKNDFDSANSELQGLQNQQREIQNNINLQIPSLNDLQKALSDLRLQRENELEGIRIQVKKWQHQVDNEPQIRRQIEQAQNKLEILKGLQPKLMDEINAAIKLKEQKQKEFDDLQNAMKHKDLKNEILSDKVKLHTDQLDAAYKNEKMNQYLLNLLDKDHKISYLATLMQNKVDKEKDLLKDVEKFKNRMNEIEGELIEDISKGVTYEEIIAAINKDRQDFQKISTGYQELLIKISSLKDLKVEINRLIVLQKKAQNELNDFEVNYVAQKMKLKKLADENIQLELKIKNLENQYDQNQQLIEFQTKDIQQKIENLKLAIEQYNLIRSQLAARENFYEDKINDQNNQIKLQSEKISQLKLDLQNILTKINNIKSRVNILLGDYQQKEKDCSAYIQYFYETEKFVKKLEDLEQKDKQTLKNLKNKITESLTVINDDIN